MKTYEITYKDRGIDTQAHFMGANILDTIFKFWFSKGHREISQIKEIDL